MIKTMTRAAKLALITCKNLEETFTLEGPLYVLINNTVEKLSEIMSNVKVRSAEELKEVSFPPDEAVWETFVLVRRNGFKNFYQPIGVQSIVYTLVLYVSNKTVD